MSTWIFQANPKTFKVDEFLVDGPEIFTWTVSDYRDQINVHDRVYLWRAGAGDSEKSGVIAEAVVISPVQRIPSDEDSSTFWTEPHKGKTETDRVWLRMLRRGSAREQLKRKWLLVDPVLSGMLILRRPIGTNFPVTDEEAERLAQMWARVGQDWSRNESLAGLWAYVETFGKPVSTLSASPVALVSELTGRAIPGVYNKVMNFRSIDPRETRAGMSGAGENDRIVWSEFFEAEKQTVRTDDLNAEFARIWCNSTDKDRTNPDVEALVAAVEREATKLVSKSLADLMAAYGKQQDIAGGTSKPNARVAKTIAYDRSPLVIAIAKARASYRCEVPECQYPIFAAKDGNPYCEVHHILPLAEGGPDTIDNVVCLCPSHHREVHLGEDSNALRTKLKEIRP